MHAHETRVIKYGSPLPLKSHQKAPKHHLKEPYILKKRSCQSPYTPKNHLKIHSIIRRVSLRTYLHYGRAI